MSLSCNPAERIEACAVRFSSAPGFPYAILVLFFLCARWDHEKKLTTKIADLWKDTTDVPIPFGTYWKAAQLLLAGAVIYWSKGKADQR